MNPSFRKLDNEEIVPIGYQRMNFHMIFDAKMEDFHGKARLMEGGHTIEHPSTITYASLVSREKSVLLLHWIP